MNESAISDNSSGALPGRARVVMLWITEGAILARASGEWLVALSSARCGTPRTARLPWAAAYLSITSVKRSRLLPNVE